MLANLFQTVYNFTDRLWLSRMGPLGIAALQLSFPLVFLMFAVAFGVTMAGTALVAQYTGAGRHEEANVAAGQVLSFAELLSIVLAIIGFFLAPAVLSLIGGEPALMEASASYLRIIYLGLPLAFGTFVVTALLNGVGDTFTPMLLMGVSVGMNIALDPFFIFGWGPFPEWGITGAAVATVISRAFVPLAGFYLLFSGRFGIHIRRKHLRLRWSVVRRIISIGGMASIGQAGSALGFTIMNGALARIGTVVLGAFGIGNAFISIVLMPAMGLGQATATMVGQNLGADQARRAKQSAWAGMGISTVILSVAAIFVLNFRMPFLGIFTSDPEVLAAGYDMLSLVAFAFPFMGIIQVVMGVYQGSGHTFYSMFFGLFRLWALRVPLVLTLPFTLGMGANGVWWAMLASNFGTAALSLVLFNTGNWMRRVIKGESLSEQAA
jgi:putative MATE family efflux protein